MRAVIRSLALIHACLQVHVVRLNSTFYEALYVWIHLVTRLCVRVALVPIAVGGVNALCQGFKRTTVFPSALTMHAPKPTLGCAFFLGKSELRVFPAFRLHTLC